MTREPDAVPGTSPRPGEAEAVEAAAQAEYLDCYMGRPDVPWESLDPDLKRQLRNVVRGGVAAAYPIIFAEGAKAGRREKHGDHEFEPGIDTDMAAEGRSPDPRWCNICGDAP